MDGIEVNAVSTHSGTYESAVLAVQNHIDSHIRQWRENFNHYEPILRQRAIDAVDALQQLRLSLFGELLPQDDGTYKVFTHDGENYVTGLSHTEARELHAVAPVSDSRLD